MAQIIRITSEALQSNIRRLLPSQQGFGEDLQASNVIQPIIDLTPAAEGSEVPLFVQQAIAFGDMTPFDANNSTVTVANSPGFYRIVAAAQASPNNTNDSFCRLEMSDGLSTKKIWEMYGETTSASESDALVLNIDVIVFLTAGDSVSAVASTRAHSIGS